MKEIKQIKKLEKKYLKNAKKIRRYSEIGPTRISFLKYKKKGIEQIDPNIRERE